MFFRSLFPSRKSRQPSRRGPRRFRPAIEVLSDRSRPSGVPWAEPLAEPPALVSDAAPALQASADTAFAAEGLLTS
jgi:hypothetical protein